MPKKPMSKPVKATPARSKPPKEARNLSRKATDKEMQNIMSKNK